jgi:hypothetical protein
VTKAARKIHLAAFFYGKSTAYLALAYREIS